MLKAVRKTISAHHCHYQRTAELQSHRRSRHLPHLLREASEYSSDAMTLDRFGFEDIDGDTLQIYRRFLALRSPESPFLTLNDEELLLKLGCLNKDHSVHTAQLTMGGLLLFGKEDSIRKRFPAYEFDIYLIRALSQDKLN
jgi:ATP-dependent DNA helicase RecG